MTNDTALRIGYVVKRYPRYSETFIVNEILAHEAAGWALEIFALRPSNDPFFQDRIARVRSPVHYVSEQRVKASLFWSTMERASQVFPQFWQTVESFEPVGGDDLHQALLLALAVRERRIDHLHAHFASLSAAVTRLAARMAGITYSFTAHAKDIFHETVDDDQLANKLADASAVVTVSDFNVRHLQARYGSAARRVRCIYNGLDLEEFPYRSPHDRPRRIVAVGRLVEKKGFGDLIDACGQLARDGVEFDCRIIGTGDQREALQARIDAGGLTDRVQLIGARPQAAVIDAIQGASVLAAPCVVGEDGNRDGMPTVLLEAMALGTPVAATPVTGIPELVRNGDTGCLVPERDPGALAGALRALLDDPALRVRLAGRGRQLIEASFDVHRSAASLRDIFRSAVFGRHGWPLAAFEEASP